jgi:hypothetical protein
MLPVLVSKGMRGRVWRMDYNNGSGCDKGDVMHAVCYSWSMDVEAKDDVYSSSTRLYMLEVALQEAKKERMAAGNSMSRSLEITHDDDRSCQFPDRPPSPLRCIDPPCQRRSGPSSPSHPPTTCV